MTESVVRFLKRPALRWTIGVIVASGLLITLWLALTLTANQPVRYASIEEHFKYGSIGSEPGGSLLRAGRRRAAAVLGLQGAAVDLQRSGCPGGYASFGFIVEPGHDLPVGVSRRRRLGIDQVGLNCAVCHTGTVRDAPDVGAADRARHAGAAARSAGASCSSCSTARSTTGSRADAVRGRVAAERRARRSSSALLLRAGLIDRLKLQTLDLRNRIAPILGERVPRWGRGPRRHVQPVQGDPVQLGPRPAAGVAS